MLEIILIVSLSKKLAAQAAAKGRSKMWGGLLVAFWLIGEVLGFVVGAALEMEFGAYGLALMGAGIGAIAAFGVVAMLSREQTSPFESFEQGGVGQFDANNPYSPPGTYPSTAR
jgi:hypothetical protein